MKTHDSFAAIKVWSLFGLSTIGMIIFAALYLSCLNSPPPDFRNVISVQPAIPPIYIQALNLMSNFENATFVKSDGVLYGMKDVKIIYSLDDAAKSVVTEDEVRTKFELMLRRNSISINPDSTHEVNLIVGGTSGPAYPIMGVQVAIKVYEIQTLMRDGQAHKAAVTVWARDYGGIVGANSTTANTFFLSSIEKLGEMFANDFLSANPRNQH